ncbi:Alkaline phosphatase synthesis transcriptional regulatory protein PhoP [[Clostridium] ultunense Esp]|uniref:Alkaline phosphatase synthesis transcriptional regulatory protein PhoP n=1 Tax=[Clostridium] ultunense Esp TaxID=1288971 RepID=M1Z663_9FIRM|nr:response regulator transcription factor [Schnuerera ultunensis]CCQ93209.1 Alkaline phosphatase synthesis transcriptional regulatory protein PhoP [[Clostridium] ultunense Esp]SHD78126.1 Alkaline phosphatase synthesis transcriptional regulatory protein PhoP [[Clostridium] ultunense Esp]
MNILVVDDEKLIVKGLKHSLEQQGYKVFTAYNGSEALKTVEEEKIDFIILDLMLPDIDGMMLCKKIREDHNMPILMLTAKDGDYDKILGFEFGADDYMTKPFNVLELLARIKAITRRFNTRKESMILTLGDLVINYYERRAYIKDKEIKLTQKEFEMLYLLAKNPGRVFTREDMFHCIWEEEPLDVRTIDVHIKNIREKIEDDIKNPKYIKTKWGVGYYFNKI